MIVISAYHDVEDLNITIGEIAKFKEFGVYLEALHLQFRRYSEEL